MFSVSRQQELIPYEAFERVTLGGAFDVSGVSGDMDALFPPSKISDLRVEGSTTDEDVMLSWTAVGQSMDDGTGKSLFSFNIYSNNLKREYSRTC